MIAFLIFLLVCRFGITFIGRLLALHYIIHILRTIILEMKVTLNFMISMQKYLMMLNYVDACNVIITWIVELDILT